MEATRAALLALLATFAVLAAPVAPASGGAETGVIPVGLGEPVVMDVDHHVYGIPEGTAGIRHATKNVMFARIMYYTEPCPQVPGFMCAPIPQPYCLAVIAPAGAQNVEYSFRWAKERLDADPLLEKLPWIHRPLGVREMPEHDCRVQ